MVVGPDFYTSPQTSEYEEVDALLNAAFNRPDEARLVHQLRSDGDMWVELVAHWEGVIAGYAALSRMRSPTNWACLGPLAVLPKFQNAAAAPDPALRSAYAIGTRLSGHIASIAELGQELRASSYDSPETIVVLGKRSFYERARFSSSRAQKLISPYPIEHTLIARSGDDVPAETLIYPSAFDDLE